MQEESHEFEAVLVRNLRPDDLDAVVALDAKTTGRRRGEFFKVKLQQALAETGIKVSLAAERDGRFAGFSLARVFYGEFGQTEAVAVLDTFGVAPEDQGYGVARALIRQLRTNLLGLGIRRLQTQVNWGEQQLVSFFQHAGFEPAPRIALDLDLEARAPKGGDGGRLIGRLRRARDPTLVKYTKSTHYALYAALEMARADGPVTVAEVASTYDVPPGALAKVFQQLVRAGIAVGVRGVGGGYVLAKPASEITVWDVIVVHDPPRNAEGNGEDTRGPKETLDRLFGEVSELVSCTFASVTLETLVQ